MVTQADMLLLQEIHTELLMAEKTLFKKIYSLTGEKKYREREQRGKYGNLEHLGRFE